MVYSSKHNNLIKATASLKDKKSRNELGLYLVEGVKMIREAVKYGVKLERVFATQKAICELDDLGIEISEVTEEVFSYLSDEKNPQGAIATIKIPKNEITAPQGDCLILEGVSDPGNLGAIIRTSAAFSYKDIYLINCADVYNPKTVRASMSGIYFVNCHKIGYEDLPSVMSGVDILVADMGGEDILKFTKTGKVAIVVGNEANGVSEKMKSFAKRIVRIDMDGKIESLNVAVACSIAMFTLKK